MLALSNKKSTFVIFLAFSGSRMFTILFKYDSKVQYFSTKKVPQTTIITILKVTPTTFTKLAKSHISAQFFVRVYVLGRYTYFETA